jgi:hypothetical protein
MVSVGPGTSAAPAVPAVDPEGLPAPGDEVPCGAVHPAMEIRIQSTRNGIRIWFFIPEHARRMI